MSPRTKIRCAGLILALASSFVLMVSWNLEAGESASVFYRDVTTSTGIHFKHGNSATADKFLIETMAGGVAIIDFDNDGWADIFVVNGARLHSGQKDTESPDKSEQAFWNRLYRNNHDGTFTDVTEHAGLRGVGYGMGVAVGDYDNDGFADLFVTNYGSVQLYHNNGNGTFTDVTERLHLNAEGWMTSAGFFDYDSDGNLDLFVCRYLDWKFSKNIYCGAKTEAGRSYCHPDNYKPVSNYLLHNNGDGTFTDVSMKSNIAASRGKALGVAFADFNNDGHPDISVANDSFQQFLFMNNGDGTFTESAVTAGTGFTEDGKVFAGMGTDAADVDDDGLVDIVSTALPNESFAYFHNDGSQNFSSKANVSGLTRLTEVFGGWGMRIFDYDNDGHKDLFFANSHVMDNIKMLQPHLEYKQKLLLLRQVSGKFVDVSANSGAIFSEKLASRGAAFADLDNDGDLDAIVVENGGALHVLRNEGGNRNAWIALQLRGTRSNRDAIGARVRLTSGSGKVQYGQVSATAGYLSGQDKKLIFGLGNENKILSAEITWPSGIKQVIANPAIRTILNVMEK